MDLNDPSLENTIKLLYPGEIQQKRVKKELQGISALNQKQYKFTIHPTQLGIKIIIELPKESLVELIKDPIKLIFPVIFEIFLDAKFPFVSPRLYCKSDFFKPSLADGRDFMDDVVEQLWTPAILLKDVILMLLRFVKKVNRLTTAEASQAIGKYYIDKQYDLEDFLSMGSVGVFPGKEVLNDKGKTEERYLVVTESFFLIFAVLDKKTNSVKLISFANIKSIANIKKNKESPNTLVFTFHDKSKKSGVSQNVFNVEEAQKLVEFVIDIGQKYGMKVNKTVKKLQDLTLEDVTAKSYENIDLEELLEHITILESKLETEISVDVINLLMALYQKTIEYFSAFNDPAYEDFVDRLHSLLKRKDVQIILQSKEESKHGKGGGYVGHEEEEEEKKEGPGVKSYSAKDNGYGEEDRGNYNSGDRDRRRDSGGYHDEREERYEQAGHKEVINQVEERPGIDLGEY